jgi:hypothetical protein
MCGSIKYLPDFILTATVLQNWENPEHLVALPMLDVAFPW